MGGRGRALACGSPNRSASLSSGCRRNASEIEPGPFTAAEGEHTEKLASFPCQDVIVLASSDAGEGSLSRARERAEVDAIDGEVNVGGGASTAGGNDGHRVWGGGMGLADRQTQRHGLGRAVVTRGMEEKGRQ